MSEADDIRSIINEAIRENSAHLIKATISATTEVLDQKLLEHPKWMKEIIDEKSHHPPNGNIPTSEITSTKTTSNTCKLLNGSGTRQHKRSTTKDTHRYPQADGKLKLNKRLKLLCIADRELWSHYSRLPSETYMKPQNTFSTYLVLFLFTFIFRML